MIHDQQKTHRRRFLRISLPGTILFPLLLIAPGLPAQSPDAAPFRLDASASVDWVPLYEGDATVGDYSTWGVTGSLGIRSSFPLGGELFLAFTPKDDDPYARSPRILIPGGWLTFSFMEAPTQGVDLFVAAGAAYVDIAGWPDSSDCVPPDCFAEGGPNFRNGSELSFLWGGGLAYRFPSGLLLRLDLRKLSKSDVFGDPSLRIGGGVGFRLW
jgi:hypothetical protein